MKSLEDIAKFNIEHADLELPEGSSTRRPPYYPIIGRANSSSRLPQPKCYPRCALNHKLTRTDYEAAKSTLQKEALENGVLRVMEEGRLDAIVGPTDGPLASISAAIGKKAIGSGWQVLSLTRI